MVELAGIMAAQTGLFPDCNTLVGRHDPSKMVGWIGLALGQIPGFPELQCPKFVQRLKEAAGRLAFPAR